jgi:hypothetical protein
MKPREAIQSALTPLTGRDDTPKVVDLVGDAVA